MGLQCFPNESSIQQKVLGLLVSALFSLFFSILIIFNIGSTKTILFFLLLTVQNNIAEVGELHGELMVQGFLDHISNLLHSPEVEVSYFAAGILAHLTSRGEEAWTLKPSLRSSLLEQLVGRRKRPKKNSF